MLDQATEHCAQTERFIRKYADLDAGENWFYDLHSNHPAVVDQAASWFRTASDPVMATTASSIGAAIQLFEHTENVNAAAVIDAGVPTRIDTVDVSLPPWDKTQVPIEATSVGDATGPFQWIEDPADALREPHDYDGDPSLRYNPTAWDLVDGGPGTLARDTVIEVSKVLAGLGWIPHPVDPLDAFVKPAVGDWAGLRRFVDVLHLAGDAAERTGIGIDRARYMLGPVWRGRAADACVVWLGAVAKPMRDAPDALDAMAAAYQRAVDGVVAFRNLLYDLLGSCIDAAFTIAGALAIGGGAAAETAGVSALVGGLVCGAEVITFCNCINGMRKAWNDAQTIMTVVKAVQSDFGAVHGGGPMPNLPAVHGNASALSVLPA
jgi:hypothetical protein